MKDINLKSFINQNGIVPVMLQSGAEITRFVESKELYNIFSDCYINDEIVRKLYSIILSREDKSPDAKRKVIRDNLGILKGWNAIQYRVKMVVKKEILGFYGQIGPQKIMYELDEKNLPIFDIENGRKKLRNVEDWQDYNQKKENGVVMEPDTRLGGLHQIIIPDFASNVLTLEKKMEYVTLPNYLDI